MTWKINEANIPDLAIGFTRGLDLLGDSIAFCRGGWQAVRDKSFPTHAFFFCRIQDRLFAFEETAQGLRPMPLSEYATDKNRIISAYYCHCWNDSRRRENAIAYLIDIMAVGGERQRYGWRTLFSKLPGIGKLIRPDPVADICSENVAEILHQFGGVNWFEKTGTKIAPDELLMAIQKSRLNHETETILGYYQ